MTQEKEHRFYQGFKIVIKQYLDYNYYYSIENSEGKEVYTSLDFSSYNEDEFEYAYKNAQRDIKFL